MPSQRQGVPCGVGTDVDGMNNELLPSIPAAASVPDVRARRPRTCGVRCRTAGSAACPRADARATRLRHTHATEVRRRFGLEAAQVSLGHAQAQVTEVYAERDLALAAKVARQIG